MGDAPSPQSFVDLFASVPDLRIDRTKRYCLASVLLVCLCGILSGANTLVAIEEIGRLRLKFLETLMPFPNGIPSHDTIGRVLAKLDPSALENMFLRWMGSVADLTEGEVVAVDGKTLRRAYDRANGGKFVHMVSAWATSNRMVLGQLRTEQKSNEITVIPELLDLLHVRGCLITIDAMGCQKDIAKKIRERGADYLLGVKENQPNLARAIRGAFEDAFSVDSRSSKPSFHETEEYAHGRVEVRRCWVLSPPDEMPECKVWKDLHAIIRVEAERTVGDKSSEATRDYISSKVDLNARDALEC